HRHRGAGRERDRDAPRHRADAKAAPDRQHPRAMTSPDAAAPVPRHPWVWAVLYFPFGLTFGFPSIALGYLASRAGVPVSTSAGVIGMTWLASGWKFTWAPLGDYTLSRKKWYRIAISLVSVGFSAMS